MSLKDWTLEDWEKWIDNNFFRIADGQGAVLVNDLLALIEEEVAE